MKEDFWIFLCFGQSNMAGQAPIEEQDLMVSDSFLSMATNDGVIKGCLPCEDYLHFSGEGYRLLGRHYAQRYLEVMKL